MKKTLYIIDGTAVVYRSYFAFKNRPLINSKGENTSAIFGFLRTIISIIENFQPQYFAITFDEREPTFRHKQYPHYKATRDKMPDDLVTQLEPITELVSSLKIKSISKPGYEADDIIGTISKKLESECRVIIVSSDKDLYQLIDDNIKLYDLKKKKSIGIDEVKSKFGISPQHVIDILALAGDSSDNIPGIPKIGEVTAKKLVKEFGSLEDIIKNHNNISSKRIKDSIEKYSEQGQLSKKLVKIKLDVPIDINLDDMKLNNIFTEELYSFCKKYEMYTFLKYFAEPKLKLQSKETSKYKLINQEKDFTLLIKELKKHNKIAIDVETNFCTPIDGKIVGISICFDTNKAYYTPIRHEYGKQLKPEFVLDTIKPILENDNKSFIGHNIKFDYMIFQNEGINISSLYFDTMVASYLLSPEEHRHNLNAVSMKYLQHRMIPLTDLIGKGKKQISFAKTDITDATNYSAEDAYITFKLWGILKNKLPEVGMEKLFFDVEMKLIKTLADIERNGIFIDTEMFKKISKELKNKISNIQQEIYKISEEKFNINSPSQLSEILFEKLNLPKIKKTKTGYSTDIDVLTKLSKDYKIARLLIQYRQLKKLKSTYIDALPKLINSKTNRIHSSFNQTVTSTGRLSSSSPNLQNIPIRTEIGRQIRKGFIAEYPDYSILSADYSQIELRVMAILSGDENLIENFRNNGDIHKQTASLIFGVNKSEVTSNQRREAKTINFGVLYGMGAYSLSEDLNISLSEAQKFIDNYFSNYPKVKKYIEQTKKFAHKNGYVKTIYNRRRYLPRINNQNRNVRAFAERIAVNTPIQGTAADIIKIAMNNIYNKIKNNRDEIQMIIQIHDELVFEIKTNSIKKYINLIKKEMESVLPDKYKDIIPISVDIGYGKSWYDAH